MTAPYIARVFGGVLVATRIPSGALHISIRDESDQLTLAIPPEDAARLRAWLAGAEDKPAATCDGQPLPAWERGFGIAAYVRRGHDGVALAIAYDDGRVRVPGHYSRGSGAPLPSVWHAMHEADRELRAIDYTLTDPAPEPPDLRGVTLAWMPSVDGECHGVAREGRHFATLRTVDDGIRTPGLTVHAGPDDYRNFFTITTREQAAAFFRACGATLEDA